MDVVKRMLPPYIVASQLKILIPVGMPITIVVPAKTERCTGPRPVVNIWWLHTAQPRNPIAMPLKTIAE